MYQVCFFVFQAMVLNGFILVNDSKLNFEESVESLKTSRKKTLREMFRSVMTLCSWTLSEIFLVIVALIYFDFLYGKTPTIFKVKDARWDLESDEGSFVGSETLH